MQIIRDQNRWNGAIFDEQETWEKRQIIWHQAARIDAKHIGAGYQREDSQYETGSRQPYQNPNPALMEQPAREGSEECNTKRWACYPAKLRQEQR